MNKRQRKKQLVKKRKIIGCGIAVTSLLYEHWKEVFFLSEITGIKYKQNKPAIAELYRHIKRVMNHPIPRNIRKKGKRNKTQIQDK